VKISDLCKRLRVPVNVTDAPNLCTFVLLSTHNDGPLQIGVTTNGKGCKLSSRIRREIASALPQDLGSACDRLGTIRRRIQEEDHLTHPAQADGVLLSDEESADQSAAFNKLVTDADLDAAKNRRIRWLSQICEYWPLRRLATITDDDVETVLKSYETNQNTTSDPLDSSTIVSRSLQESKKGRIILAGSGPGHPDLLTRATHKAILTADVILADKLVPAGVLDLIPRRTPVHIARKFPGNAERAQEELLTLGLEGLKAGKTVLRLKQGDPYIYGRGGEEFEFFRREGYGDRIVVLPGITSALSAPLFSTIPATQRGVADQVLICTGTGRKGLPTIPPEFVSTRTVVFLMSLHRITGLVEDLTTYAPESTTAAENEKIKEEDIDLAYPADINESLTTTAITSSPAATASPTSLRKLYPLTTPCAVIERASCPDQRVIRTTLAYVAEAIEEEGSRPPGLLVVGNACEVLCKSEQGRKWVVEEGFKGLEGFEGEGMGIEEFIGPVSVVPTGEKGLEAPRMDAFRTEVNV
jgi:uroporphyrin-III C-methyltransferase